MTTFERGSTACKIYRIGFLPLASYLLGNGSGILKIVMIRQNRGITLIELLVVIALVSIIAVIAAPQLGLFKSASTTRECATTLIQNMRLARAMAIKENRQYMIVFDTANQRYMIGHSSTCVAGDCDLLDPNLDTFGICKDTDNDRYPNNDTDANGDGVPDCVRVVNLSDCGSNIIFGYGTGTTPPNGPNASVIPASGVNFSGTPPSADFNTDGSMGKLGSVYFQQTTRGYSNCVRVSNNVGSTSMWKWDGDANNAGVTTWTELR